MSLDHEKPYGLLGGLPIALHWKFKKTPKDLLGYGITEGYLKSYIKLPKGLHRAVKCLHEKVL